MTLWMAFKSGDHGDIWGWYQALSKETLEFRGFPTTILNLLVVIPKLYRHIEPDKSSWTSRHLCTWWLANTGKPKVIHSFFLNRIYYSLLFQSSTLIHFDSPSLQTIPQADIKIAVIAPGHSLGCLQAIPAAHNGNSSYASRVVLGWSKLRLIPKLSWPVPANLADSSISETHPNHPKRVSQNKEVWISSNEMFPTILPIFSRICWGKASWKHHLAWSAHSECCRELTKSLWTALSKRHTSNSSDSSKGNFDKKDLQQLYTYKM